MLSNLPSLSFFPAHRSCVLEVNLYLQVWVQLSQSTPTAHSQAHGISVTFAQSANICWPLAIAQPAAAKPK